MFLIILLYALLASTFTLGKAALDYASPLFVISARMLGSGILLLGYLFFFHKKALKVNKSDWLLFIQIILFHIYIAFVGEFWALQYLTSAKTSIFYNLAPFVTAIFAYYLFNIRLTKNQKIGLLIGFFGFLPILITQAPNSEDILANVSFFSLPELVIILSVISASYGWIVMKQLMDRHYSPIAINGIGMFLGGWLSFITMMLFEGIPTFNWVNDGTLSEYFYNSFGSQGAALIMASWYIVLLILVANIAFYNLYSLLLKEYSATFLSFAGFLTPIFAAIFGWIFRGETVSWGFVATVVLVSFGLYLFYKDELKIKAT